MPKTSTPNTGGGVQAVKLALGVLEFLAGQPGPRGVTEIARALGVTKSRIYRHLQTLQDLGYINQSDESNKYKIGTRLVTAGLIAASNTSLMLAARDVVQQLRDSLGHSTVVSQIERDGPHVIHVLPGSSPYSIRVNAGRVLSFERSAQGKVALAFADPDLMARHWELIRSKADGRPGAGQGDFEKEIALVRERGWAMEANDPINVNVLAVPILDRSNNAIGTLALIDFDTYLNAPPKPDVVATLQSAASRISDGLGQQNSFA